MAASPSLNIVLGWLCRLVLGAVFIYAGAIKLTDPTAFATDIDHYRLLPFPLTIVVAVYLPWVELVCGGAVLIRWRERGALLLILGLCLLFSGAIASAWLRGLDISCGCFGHSAAPATLPVAFAHSLALGLIALFLLKSRTGCEIGTPLSSSASGSS